MPGRSPLDTETINTEAAEIQAESDNNKPEFKSYPLKAADVKLNDNTFRGIGAFMGNVDHGEDVIAPGAFSKALPEFLKSGFVPIGHDWYEKPVAMPTAAEEDGNKLIIEAEFHSTPSAQEARTVVMERLGKGLDVGLSIGFDIESAKEFEDGEKLLEFVADNGYDIKLFDQAGIKAHKTRWGLRLITKIRRLFEVSIVSVPMNPLAVATAAKVYATDDFKKLTKLQDFEEFLREAGFSRFAATQFVSQFKGILLPRDAGGDAPDPDGQEIPAETAGQEPPTEPVVITPPKRPLLFTRDGRIIPHVTEDARAYAGA